MHAVPSSQRTCPRCRGLNVDSAKFCNFCGAALVEGAVAEAHRTPSVGQRKVCPGCERINELAAKFCYDCGSALPKEASAIAVGDPASLGARITAGLIDSLAVAVLFFAVELAAWTQEAQARPITAETAGAALQARINSISTTDLQAHLLVVCLVYFTVTCAAWGRSVGQASIGLRVIRRDGHAPSWLLSLVRAALSLPTLGLLWIPFSQNGRALQDFMTSTRVVTTRG